MQQGTLDVTGTLVNSPFTVTGGTLRGTGTVGSLAVNGGIVAPGNSIGTLNVAGNVGFAAGATYEVEINAAGESDRISAGGAATLNGATVQPVLLSPLTSFGPSTTYTILSAAGGVTGTFADITDNLLFVDFSLGYTPTEVLLTLARISFSAAAQTPNQINVANALDAGGGPLALALLGLTSPADARLAFDALSGEIHASLQTSLAEDSRFIRNAVLERLRGAVLRGRPGNDVAR